MRTIYTYKNCSSCRDALKWLTQHGIPHQVRPIRETPPSLAELETALNSYGGDIKCLFNRSGADYRELGLKDKLPKMSQTEALSLLSQNGNLIKRPFLIGNARTWVGFQPELWEKSEI
jgi:arsenate reductase